MPVPYFHIVFTLPHELNDLAIHHPKEVYNSLFRASWQTIEQIGKDPKHLGAKMGMTAVLHTWGQNLSLHPHLHCIVPGGGITNTGRWKQARNKGKYLFPTKVLAVVFRAKFMAMLRGEGVVIPAQIGKALFGKSWLVYAKQPFFGPKQVIEYLGRYTHKIAISNHRIKRIEDDGTVHFTWKDYKQGNQRKIMALSAHEFLRRFCLHILPRGFVRIRHYGMLSSRNKSTLLNQAREYFGLEQWKRPTRGEWKAAMEQRMDITLYQCPFCTRGIMEVVEHIEPVRGPPANIFKSTTSFNVA